MLLTVQPLYFISLNHEQVTITMNGLQLYSFSWLFLFFCYFQTKDFLQTSFTRVDFHKLEGKSIKVFFVNSILNCAWRCQRFPECLSLNIADQRNKDGLYECVLLRNRSTGLLKPSKFYHHYTLFEPFLGSSRNVTPNPDVLPTEKEWQKINVSPVCFGAKNSSYGSFYIKENGSVSTVKLVHLSGYVTCNYAHQSARSNWGCGAYVSGNNKSFPDKMFTIITNDEDQKTLPQDEFINNFNTFEYGLPGGYTSQSPELIFPNFTTTMNVTAGQEYRIWYGQDLKDIYEDKNDGTACVDVYMYGGLVY